jgi:hypothetical protein
VKATKYWRNPYLLWTEGQPLKASSYVLVAIDVEKRRGRVVGYASRSMVASARLKDFGHGPRRMLYSGELITADELLPLVFG